MKSRFDTPKGLNKNWRLILQKEPEWKDVLDELVPFDYDVKQKMLLMYSGRTDYDTCFCGKKIPTIGNTFCSKKCSSNDEKVKEKKLNFNHQERNEKISLSLKGRNDYHKKSWKSRKEKYGISGLSEQGRNSLSEKGNYRIEEMQKSCIEKYGIDNWSKTEQGRSILSNLQKELQNSRSELPVWLYNKKEFSEIYEKYGINGIIEKSGCCKNLAYVLSIEYNLRDKTESAGEKEIRDYITSLGIDCESRNRSIINPYELDIHIPTYGLAIEYNGLYWHSAGDIETDNKIKNNHIRKTDMCEEKGLQLLHIFENEWIDPVKRDIWKSVISHKLRKNKRIYARKCKMSQITTKEANKFCEENHLQGKCNGSLAYGLFYDDKLVQVVVFGKPRYNKNMDTELLRMCTLKYCCVVGGASKLLKDKHFISYANRRWSIGDVYEKLGMKHTQKTPPCFYYIKNGKLHHRSQFMKHTLEEKLDLYDPKLSGSENCFRNGMRKIYDCGTIVYIQ